MAWVGVIEVGVSDILSWLWGSHSRGCCLLSGSGAGRVMVLRLGI